MRGIVEGHGRASEDFGNAPATRSTTRSACHDLVGKLAVIFN
jgi:hypothetical protein